METTWTALVTVRDVVGGVGISWPISLPTINGHVSTAEKTESLRTIREETRVVTVTMTVGRIGRAQKQEKTTPESR